MEEINSYHKHYITVDEQNRIVVGFSDAFCKPDDDDICINEQGGYQFRLYPDGEENPSLTDWDGIPLYKLEDGYPVRRTEEEIEADRAELPVPEEPPTQLDRVEAQVTYTALMTDTLIALE